MEQKTNVSKATERLESLDVLRGFDMFWIIGGGVLIVALAKTTGWIWLQAVAEQMGHVKWIGFHFYDLIFPLFMFVSGVAIPYAINSKVEIGAKRNLLFRKILKRAVILILLGILYNGALQAGFTNARFASVLSQIGVGYFLAATINLYTKSFSVRVIWVMIILGINAVLQLAVPVPGIGAGSFEPGLGINAWIDQLILPGRLHYGTFDPQGVICMISASSVTLMGSLAGSILRDGNQATARKAFILVVTGAVLIVLALSLSPVYPIIKNAATVPFNFLTSGISFMLLALFYFVIDVKKWTKGIISYKWMFFKVIGMNSILIYMISHIVNFYKLSGFFTGWLAIPFGDWINIIGGIAIEWLILYYLYKKGIFLKV